MTDDDNSTGLTRRRALTALGVIGAGSAAAGAGTFALFSDTKTGSAGLNAGTISLVKSSSVSFKSGDIKPTDQGSSYATLKKDSGTSLTGDLSISVPSVTSSESDNPSAETNTSTPGELDDQVQLKIWIGTDSGSDTTVDAGDIGLNADGSTTSGTKGAWEAASQYNGTAWSNVLPGFSGPVTFNVEWKFPDLGTNNQAQGDTLTVDFEFTLTQ
ncbi:MAG: TasA family protein [Halobacteriaceae archaeon]